MASVLYRDHRIETYDLGYEAYPGSGTWRASVVDDRGDVVAAAAGRTERDAIRNAKMVFSYNPLGPVVRDNPLTSNTKVVIAVAATAGALLAAAGIYEYVKNKKSSGNGGGGGTVINNGPQPHAVQVPAVQAPAPYTKVTSIGGNVPGQSGTYLVSFDVPAGKTLTQMVQALPAGIEVSQSWDAGQLPPNWPADDPNNQNDNAARAVVTYSGLVAIPINVPGVTVYKAG